MKATELRIGNYIKGCNLYEGRELTVSRVDHDVICFFGCFAGEYPNDCEGIELTPEWLEKFGFSKQTGMSGNLFYSLNDFQWDKSLCMALDDDYLSLDHIKYVHQLQNLHMALTGQELTIKMPV